MDSHPYTCISCALAFSSAASQREHYASELHRYNSKRRVAGLGPVTEEVFQQKIATTVATVPESEKRLYCKPCKKSFATEATQETHNQSKKHKETILKAAANVNLPEILKEKESVVQDVEDEQPEASTSTPPEDIKFTSTGNPQLDILYLKRVKYSPAVKPTTCLFCPHTSSTAAETLSHMKLAHSFSIPDDEYLVDLEGLLSRLGEEIGVWNVCIWCGKGFGGAKEEPQVDADGEENDVEMENSEKEEDPVAARKVAQKGLEAVRAHMVAKSHCKIPYSSAEQQLDISDFYDFRPSYPDYQERLARKEQRRKERAERKAQKDQANAGWEDVDGSDVEMEEGAEVIYESDSESESSESEFGDDEIPDSGVTYGDTPYELVLPSGAIIGHRAHKYIHRQNLKAYIGGVVPFQAAKRDGSAASLDPDAPSNRIKRPSKHSQLLLQLVSSSSSNNYGIKGISQRALTDAALVPARGGGSGELIKARNKGEAKEAGKAIRQFKELRAYNEQAFIRGIKGNSQKHYRDPLLQ